jgi:hypothetical protein
MSFQTFLQALGAAAHVDVAAAAQAGGCTLRFTQRMEVVFEHDAAADTVQVFATVLTLDGMPGETRTKLLEALLQLHLFGLATGGNYFGYDPQLGRAILFRTLSMAAPDAESVAGVESFVNQLERWQQGLLDYASKSSSRPAEPPVMTRV